MRSSEKTDEISKALVVLWGRLNNPPKTTEAGGGARRYKYATLPEILDQVRPQLHANGLVLVQDTITDDGKVGVTSRLMHISGQWLEYGPLLLPAGDNAQSAGSAITYARRYQLCAALGIAADEDDDGAKAKRSSKKSESWGDAVPKKTSGEEGEPYGEGGEPGGSSSETTSSGGDDEGARSSDEGSGSRTVSPSVQPLEDDPSLDTPATNEQWARLPHALTGAQALTKVRAAVKSETLAGPMPTSQTDLTRRQLAWAIEEALKK